LKLKKDKNAVILAHNYQDKEVQEVADIVGDSLKLSLAARETDADIILFAGVKFMAEQAKVLNPEKKVLIPDPSSLCSLAAMVNEEMVKEYKERYPDAPLVVYVNSPIEIKAMADYIVTSANALDVISKLESDVVLFSPDSNLANWVAEKTGKKIITIPPTGHCYVHLLITGYDVIRMKEKYPDAVVMVHPEVPKEAKRYADFIGGTGAMVKFVSKSNARRFLVGTEVGMLNRLRREFPKKQFIPIVDKAQCIGMKKINIEKVYWSLLDEVYEVEVDQKIAKRVREALERTFALTG